MSTNFIPNSNVSVPDSLGTGVATVAIVGPNPSLRQAVRDALEGCYEGGIDEFSSYPTGMDEVPHLLGQVDVVLIELDSNPDQALDLIEGVCAKGTSTVMVYSQISDSEARGSEMLVRCMRAGAREFLSYPFEHGSLAESLVRAAARRSVSGSKRRTGGRQLIFMGAKGGVGVTTLACNYAVTMARESASEKTLLVDLDIPLGDAALNLGLKAEYSTVNALQNINRLDAQFLSKLLVKHDSGLYVLAAPGRLPSFSVTQDAVDHLLTVARQDFDNVVVDMGVHFELADISFLAEATSVYLVTQAGIPELRNSNRLISQCFDERVKNLEIVLNRAESRRVGVSEQQISMALTKPAKWKVPNDYTAVRKMQSSASTLEQSESPIQSVLSEMVQEACGKQPQTGKRKKKNFKLFNFGKAEGEESEAVDEKSTSASGLTQLNLGGGEQESETPEVPPSEDAAAKTEEYTVGEKRVYKGDTYVRGEDGMWYLDAPEETPVAQEKITLEWNAPEPITYGTRLGAEQFNAVASVQGIFMYTPGENYLLSAGTHTLWVSFIPRDTEPSAESMLQASVTLVVTKATPSISWPTPSSVPHGTPLSDLQLCAMSDVPGSFEYSCTVGEVLPEGEHELMAVFIPEDTANYANAHASVQFKVTKPVPDLHWSEPQKIVYGTRLTAAQLNAYSPVEGSYVYSPAENALLPAGEHELTVTMTPYDADRYAPAQTTVKIAVARANPVMQWPEPAALFYGDRLADDQLCAKASVPGTFNYIPSKGEILPAGKHTLNCIFTPEDTANYEIQQITATVQVSKATPTIQWATPAPIDYGTPLSKEQLNASCNVAGRMQYLPGEGAVLGSGMHSPLVQFVPEDTANYNVARATVPLTVNQGKPAIRWEAPAPITYGTPLGSAQLCATSSVQGIFSYQPEEGTVLSEGSHRITASFMPADVTNYKKTTVEIELVVRKATPAAIAWTNPEPITYGTPLSEKQLSASTQVQGRFGYSPAAGEILPAGQHKLTVVFIPTDTNVPPSQADVTLKVMPAKPAIQWPQPEPIHYGQVLSARELCAKSSVAGVFSYTPQAGELLPAGKHQLKAAFIPQDKVNYVSDFATVSLHVKKIAPLIHWDAPAPIQYGTPLSGTQLNAKADVDGSFAYAPALGNVLAEGRQMLSVIFTPKDTANFTTVQETVELQVEGFASIASFPVESIEVIPVAAAPAPVPTPVSEPEPEAVSEEKSSVAPETRIYKGAVYEKRSDGKWHLQK